MSEVAAKISEKDKQKAIDASKATVKAAYRMRQIVRARKNYLPFVQLMMPDPTDPDDIHLSRYQAAKFHLLLAEQLEKVERGDSLRTIISLPPGHGKSELAAKKFIPWFIAKDPYRHTMFAGYSDDFAGTTGRSVRDLMRSELFAQVFPGCQLAPGSASNSFLKTTEGGESIFVGVGGQATGKRAHLLVIDDPIKNREEADNPLIREKLWKWFNDVAMTRLADFSSRVVIIQTRWHEDDLIGRLTDPTNDHYDKETAAEWETFEIPALAVEKDPMGRKPGEALWPEKFNQPFLERIQRANPRGFASLYQGRPSPEDGDHFKREWIKYYLPEELPPNLTLYGASDHAVSEKQGRDYTVLLPFGVDPYDNIYILSDVWWHRRQTPEVVEAMLWLLRKYKPLIWTAENGHISKSIGPFLRKRMHETQTYVSIQELTPSKSKMQRSQSIQGRMSMGKVYFPKNAPWLEKAISELLKFPSGKHDDFVDAISWAGITLGQQYGGVVIEKGADIEPPFGSFEWLKRSEEWALRQNEAVIPDGY